ncbi:MAG: holo-ACP synthase [Firmicutes bacterium]|nr:holo-ACP synthase [Bacillota bacterium]
MVIGTGCDIVEIARIEKAVAGRTFLEKCFSNAEISFFEKRKMRSETIAGNFAAKEAVSKAMGTGFRGFSIKEIEVLRNELEAPFVVLNGMALNVAEKRKIKNIKISISHCGEYAMAFAVAEGDETHEGC